MLTRFGLKQTKVLPESFFQRLPLHIPFPFSLEHARALCGLGQPVLPSSGSTIKVVLHTCCRSVSSESFYVAYSTADQVVGLLAWPIDGDPSKTLGLIAHPGGVVGMGLSHDSCKLVTAGADDGSVMVWQVIAALP